MTQGGERGDERDAARSASDEIRRIVRDEIERASRDEWARRRRLARAVGALAIAFFALYLGAVFLTLMAVYILGTQIEPWMAAAIVGGTILAGAALVARWAWGVFRDASEAP